jgi:hypothetical protein
LANFTCREAIGAAVDAALAFLAFAVFPGTAPSTVRVVGVPGGTKGVVNPNAGNEAVVSLLNAANRATKSPPVALLPEGKNP